MENGGKNLLADLNCKIHCNMEKCRHMGLLMYIVRYWRKDLSVDYIQKKQSTFEET